MDNWLSPVVEVLAADSVFVRGIRKFGIKLGISDARLYQLQNTFAMGTILSYELIHEILKEWIQINGDAATVKELRMILEKGGWNDCSRKISMFEGKDSYPMLFPGASTSKKSNLLQIKPFGLGEVVSYFAGRDEEIDSLNKYFLSSATTIVLLTGLGGIGKTQLATKFARDVENAESPNTSKTQKLTKFQIVKTWLDGDNSLTIQKSVTGFCKHLRLSAKDDKNKPLKLDAMLKKITKKLASLKNLARWLVVIDNVDEMHNEFKTVAKSLRNFGSQLFLLVTSRRRDIFKGVIELEHFPLSILSDQSSIQFVKTLLKIDDNSFDKSIHKLCELLGNFPLALVQAVAYIKERKIGSLKGQLYSVCNYLEDLSQKDTVGLDQDNDFSDYTLATIKVWNISLDRLLKILDGKLALEVLTVLSFINPDNIQVTFVQKLYNNLYNLSETVDRIKCGLELLLKYSLIASSDEIIYIHRLVQLAVRVRMPMTDYKEMLNRFWRSIDVQQFNKSELVHLIQIWQHSIRFRELDKARATTIHVFFEQLVDTYEFDKVLEEGCNLLLDLYGPESPQYLRMTRYVDFASRTEALGRLQFAYGKLKDHLGEEHVDTISTAVRIVGLLSILNKKEDCLNFCLHLQDVLARNCDKTTKPIIEAKLEVGWALSELKENSGAVKLWTEAFKYQGNLEVNSLETRSVSDKCLHKDENFSDVRQKYHDLLSKENNLQRDDFSQEALSLKTELAKTMEEMGYIEQALEKWEGLASVKENQLNRCFVFKASKKVIELRGRVKAPRSILGACNRQY